MYTSHIQARSGLLKKKQQKIITFFHSEKNNIRYSFMMCNKRYVIRLSAVLSFVFKTRSLKDVEERR